MSLRDILAYTAADHDLTIDQMLNPMRIRPLAYARQQFVWRAHMVVGSDGQHKHSYPAIARFIDHERAKLGWTTSTHHTTCLHAARVHAERNGLWMRTYVPIVRRQRAISNVHKTHCVHGHALTPDNLERYALQVGYRKCLICHKAWRQTSKVRREAMLCHAVAA